MNYTIGDAIIRIKNAALSRRRIVSLIYSKSIKELCNLLVKEGYLSSVKEEGEGNKSLVVEIAKNNRMTTFTDVRLISKPSLRIYKTYKELEPVVMRSMGKIIVSTSKGLMTGRAAIEKKQGGQLLFEIW